MAWSARNNASSAVWKPLANTSCTVTKPSGTTEGDLMVVMISSQTVRTPTGMSGWNLVEDYQGTGHKIKVYWKICGATQANLSLTNCGTGAMVAIWTSFYGGDLNTTTPFDKDNIAVVTNNSTSFTASTPALADVNSGNLVITHFFTSFMSSPPTLSVPSGETALYNAGSTNSVAAVFYETQESTGSTGTKSTVITSDTVPNQYVDCYIVSFNVNASSPSTTFSELERFHVRGLNRGIFSF